MFTGKRTKLEPSIWWTWVLAESAALAGAVLLMLGLQNPAYGGPLLVLGAASWAFRIYNFEIKR